MRNVRARELRKQAHEADTEKKFDNSYLYRQFKKSYKERRSQPDLTKLLERIELRSRIRTKRKKKEKKNGKRS